MEVPHCVTFVITGGMLVVSVSVAGLVTLAAMTQPALAPEAKHTLLQYVTGKYLLPGNCKVNFEWEDPQTVGETMTFTVKVHVFIIRTFLSLWFIRILQQYSNMFFKVLSGIAHRGIPC
jgi:hypothetical protein